MAAKKDYGIIFWIHLAIIVMALLSPFWLSWEIILIGICLGYMQLFLFKGCIFTRFELGSTEETFRGHYFRKIGFKINSKKLKLFFYWIEPIMILSLAIIWQVIFGRYIFI